MGEARAKLDGRIGTLVTAGERDTLVTEWRKYPIAFTAFLRMLVFESIPRLKVKANDDGRNVHIVVTCTADELHFIELRAGEEGESMSSYVRGRLFVFEES